MKYFLILALLLLPALAFAQGDFRPLTSIPAFSAIENTNNLSGFFNSLYEICIGIAAVLAVFQIIRSGITYMMASTGFVEKREAKATILQALFGLLLVLSPAIVFGIIDPRILDLNLDVSDIGAEGSSVEDLTDGYGTPGGGGAPGTGPAGLNWVYRFPDNVYFFVIGQPIVSPEEGVQCYFLAYGTGGTQEECQEVRAEFLEAAGDTETSFTNYYDCVRSPGASADVPVHADTNLPVCEL